MQGLPSTLVSFFFSGLSCAGPRAGVFAFTCFASGSVLTPRKAISSVRACALANRGVSVRQQQRRPTRRKALIVCNEPPSVQPSTFPPQPPQPNNIVINYYTLKNGEPFGHEKAVREGTILNFLSRCKALFIFLSDDNESPVASSSVTGMLRKRCVAQMSSLRA